MIVVCLTLQRNLGRTLFTWSFHRSYIKISLCLHKQSNAAEIRGKKDRKEDLGPSISFFFLQTHPQPFLFSAHLGLDIRIASFARHLIRLDGYESTQCPSQPYVRLASGQANGIVFKCVDRPVKSAQERSRWYLIFYHKQRIS